MSARYQTALLSQLEEGGHAGPPLRGRRVGDCSSLILTVTPNACVDKTYRIENFSLNRVHRPSEQRTYAGGKGINVARVYRAMGGSPLVTGFLGGHNGEVIRHSLRDEGLAADFVETQGESRLCIAVIDPKTGAQTEVNETGPEVHSSEVEALRDKVEELIGARNPSCLALCGSLPPGVDYSFYADMLFAAAASFGIRCALDSSGKAMELAVRAERKPWLLKVNLAELETLAGKTIASEESTAAEAHTIAQTGVTIVAATLGERGCIGLKDGVVWKAAPPRIEFVSGVGSGDSFLGAFLWSIEEGAEFPEALRLATAAGAANAVVYGSGFVIAERVHRLAEDVQLTKLG